MFALVSSQGSLLLGVLVVAGEGVVVVVVVVIVVCGKERRHALVALQRVRGVCRRAQDEW